MAGRSQEGLRQQQRPRAQAPAPAESSRSTSYEEALGALSDEELRGKTDEFKSRIREQTAAERTELERLRASSRSRATAGWRRYARRSRSRKTRSTRPSRTCSSEILPEAFACVREASRRTIGLRHYDVQVLGGIVLHRGPHRRDEDRRGQNAGRHAAHLSQRAHRPRRAPGHRQRLPGAPRRAVDGTDLPPARSVLRLHRARRRASSSIRLRGQRLPHAQPAAGRAQGSPISPTSPTARTTSSASTTCATT